MKNLQEKSPIYYAEADIYDAFAQAEDAEGLVLQALQPLVAGKRVLDLGCGTGKYVELLAPHAAHIIGLDAAPAQLAIARRRADGLRNVDFALGDALDASLPKEKYDIVLACWMLGTVADKAKRAAILRRMEKLAPHIVLVENAEGSEFEAVRGRVNDPRRRTRRYNEWLIGQGFRETDRLEALFEFRTVDEARNIFAAIWGEDKRPLLTARHIGHKIAIYQKRIGI